LDDPNVGMGAGEWKDVNGTADQEEVDSATATAHQAVVAPVVVDDDEEIEDGEVDESSEAHNEAAADTNHAHGSSAMPPAPAPPAPKTTLGPQLPHPTSTSGIAPEAAASQGQTLENLKMAYYWAGYYSGLYDGQQQAQAHP